jgi:hypothetical protein
MRHPPAAQVAGRPRPTVSSAGDSNSQTTPFARQTRRQRRRHVDNRGNAGGQLDPGHGCCPDRRARPRRPRAFVPLGARPAFASELAVRLPTERIVSHHSIGHHEKPTGFGHPTGDSQLPRRLPTARNRLRTSLPHAAMRCIGRSSAPTARSACNRRHSCGPIPKLRTRLPGQMRHRVLAALVQLGKILGT